MPDNFSDVNKSILICCGTLLLAHVSPADTGALSNDEAAPPIYEKRVRPFIRTFCMDCHGEDNAKAGLRLDLLKPEVATPGQFAAWLKVHDKLAEGEMPPPRRTQPLEAERQAVVQWIAHELSLVESKRQRDEGRAVIRRLNRIEYHNTVRDLLAIGIDMKQRLPSDAAAEGFDTVGAALNVYPEIMEAYLEAADAALDAAIATRTPERLWRRYTYKQDRAGQNPGIFLIKEDAVVLFGTCCTPTTLTQFRAPSPGRYQFKIATYAHQSARVSFRVYAGRLLDASGASRLIDHFEASSKPGVVTFEHHLEAGDTIQILPDGTGDGFRRIEPRNYKGPGLAVQWIEIDGPLYPQWPPESHRVLFGDLPLMPVTTASRRLTVDSEEPLADAERLLRSFIPRAFRRPAAESEVELYVGVARRRLDEGVSFEQAMRTAYRAILTSPSFLFRTEVPGTLDSHALASRLSYFLWSSMPDERLFALAKEQRLISADVLRGEVERMLNSSQAREFVQNFTGQWLGLRKIGETVPDKMLYPEFDELLQQSMVRETESFFSEMLEHDLSILNFIDSDFSMLNERLARHYGIPGVEGLRLRRVRLPKESHRGGLLGQAAILKITANGTTTSPVLRGVWVLESLLGQRPPPPPADVASLEPDIRGAVTIREQLVKHRAVESCATCHRKIDPPGFALENFDVIGGWREFYRSADKGEPITLTAKGEPVRYRKGPAVDASGVAFNGKTFRNIDDMKEILLGQKEQVARTVAAKLLTYATGEGIAISDRSEIQRIVESSRERNYGLRTLVHSVVSSERFLKK
jgi:mono/diheme cytochrome c family protein